MLSSLFFLAYFFNSLGFYPAQIFLQWFRLLQYRYTIIPVGQFGIAERNMQCSMARLT